MAAKRGAAAAHQQPEPIVQLLSDALHAKRVGATRHDLDGESDAIEPPADFGDNGGLGIAEFECIQTGGRPLGEQLHDGKSERLGRHQAVILRR